MGHKCLRPGGPVSARTAAEERYPLRHLTIFDLGPPAIDGSLPAPVRETLLGRDRNELACPLIQGSKVADEQKQPDADGQAARQQRRIIRPLSLGDDCITLFQRLVRVTKTEKGIPQIRLGYCVGVCPGLIGEPAMGNWIIRRKHLFQMRSG